MSVTFTPEVRAKLVRDIARAIFATIDPAADYFLARDDIAEFNLRRLFADAPVNLVGTGTGLGPIRSRQIYRVVTGEPGQNEISEAWCGMIEAECLGVTCFGRDITLGQIHAAAERDVAIRISSLEP